MRDLVAPSPGFQILMLQLERARQRRRALHDPILAAIALAFVVELGLLMPLACVTCTAVVCVACFCLDDDTDKHDA